MDQQASGIWEVGILRGSTKGGHSKFEGQPRADYGGHSRIMLRSGPIATFTCTYYVDWGTVTFISICCTIISHTARQTFLAKSCGLNSRQGIFRVNSTVKPLRYTNTKDTGTSLNRATDYMLTLQKLWAVQWVWPITAYVFVLHSEMQTSPSYGHPLIPRHSDKRGLTE